MTSHERLVHIHDSLPNSLLPRIETDPDVMLTTIIFIDKLSYKIQRTNLLQTYLISSVFIDSFVWWRDNFNRIVCFSSSKGGNTYAMVTTWGRFQELHVPFSSLPPFSVGFNTYKRFLS